MSRTWIVSIAVVVILVGCRSSREWREQSERVAERHIADAQAAVTGRLEDIKVETAADTFRRRLMLDQHLPLMADASLGIRDLHDTPEWQSRKQLLPGGAYESKWDSSKLVRISLADAIIIGARNSRDYQKQKEVLFQAALSLDLEDHEFQNTFTGMLKSTFESGDNGDKRNNGVSNKATMGVVRQFKNGAELAASFSVDLVKMLTGEKGSSWGFSGDASISIPLMRGAGEFIVAESLTQAQRNLVYQVRSFEQFKRDYVVSVATSYLNVLQAKQRITNQAENYKRVVTSTRRSRRMADAGLLPENQFDQAVQDELSARDNWVTSKQNYENVLDSFKILLGLPPDAQVEPDDSEVERLRKHGQSLGGSAKIANYLDGKVPDADAPVELVDPGQEGAGPYEIASEKAIAIALKRRPDLLNAYDSVWDAQRAVLIAEDSLRAEVTLMGTVSAGEGRSLSQANMPDGSFKLNRAHYTAPLVIDLPFERTAERNRYRNSLIHLEQTVRQFQAQEDTIKKNVRSCLRTLLQNRSSVVIQRQAVVLAARRVDSTSLLLQAGRAEMRDVLEAQNALLSAQNSLLSALVSYRVNELEIQRELGVLQVSVDGIWKEATLE